MSFTDTIQFELSELRFFAGLLRERAEIRRTLGEPHRATDLLALVARIERAINCADVPSRPEWLRLERVRCVIEDVWAETVDSTFPHHAPRAERLLRSIERRIGDDLEFVTD